MWTSILFILLQIGLILTDSQNVKTCGYPGSPAHASVTFSSDTLEVGTTATYVCNNGYELLGPQRRLCNNNGTWTPAGVPFCVLNVAVGKAAMQSSSLGQGVGSAQKAVDGSSSQLHNPATCSATAPEVSPWWYVNLLEPYLVQLVRIDFGDMLALSNLPASESANLGANQIIVVRVGNTRPDLGTNALCNTYRGHVEPGRPLYLPCTRPMAGAFVSVHIESAPNSTLIKRSLSICETFVYTDYALSSEQCPTFRDQPLGSSSTYNGKCYIFYNNRPTTFEKAKRHCEIHGGTLVDETSPALQGFLSWELYRRHRADLSGQYWLGVHRERNSNDQSWHWINGRELKLSFWNLPGASNQSPPSSDPNLNCARFDGGKGWLWSETNCESNLNFICQHRPLTCGKPERPANATILSRTNEIGSIIEYRCSPGNFLVGPNIRTCLPNGFFSEYAPKCKYVECGDAAPIDDGQYKFVNGTRSYLSQVQYSCKTGYVLVGRSILTCDADHRWNGPPPRCEPIQCAPPKSLANGYVRLSPQDGTKFGASAQYGCLPGFQLHGKNNTLVCSLSGYWLGEVPTCKEIRITTSTTTTTTTSLPPITIDLTKAFTSSGSSNYASTNKTNLASEYETTRNKFESVWSKIPSLSTSSSTYTTEQPTVVYSSTQRSSSTVIKNKQPSSTSRPSSSTNTPPPTTNYNLGVSPNINKKQQSHSSSGKDSNYYNKVPKIVTKNTSEKIDGINSFSRKSTSPKAKFNMVGIIALAIFGSFVFLAAIITIVIIVFRRYKHTSSSLDAQTISTLDSNSDQNGFYRNYQKAWENLKYSASSYKPGGDYTFSPLNVSPQHIQQIRPNQIRNGIYNEEYRDVNEITLNADVAALYSRPDRQPARPKKDNLINELYQQQNVRRKF